MSLRLLNRLKTSSLQSMAAREPGSCMSRSEASYAPRSEDGVSATSIHRAAATRTVQHRVQRRTLKLRRPERRETTSDWSINRLRPRNRHGRRSRPWLKLDVFQPVQQLSSLLDRTVRPIQAALDSLGLRTGTQRSDIRSADSNDDSRTARRGVVAAAQCAWRRHTVLKGSGF